MEERLYWLGFSLFPGIGPGRFFQLLSAFGTAEKAWNASAQSLHEVLSGEKLIANFLVFREQVDLISYAKKLQEKHVSYLLFSDDTYPKLLKQLSNPPFVLFFKGNSDLLSETAIAIVGTRKITEYGRQVTSSITQELVSAGIVIVSGLALGVDAVAHQTALDCHGKTIAVLGCGIDCPYPRENTLLYQHIFEKQGLIVSEYGLGVSPTRGTFPSRNRIIAGLSCGIVVSEGAERSGALITAEYAFANKRAVFAIPGAVTSRLSDGPYQLLKKGALIARNGKDILESLRLSSSSISSSKKIIKGETADEQLIIDLLANEPVHIDALAKKTGFVASSLGSLLSIMEMKGFVTQTSSGYFLSSA